MQIITHIQISRIKSLFLCHSWLVAFVSAEVKNCFDIYNTLTALAQQQQHRTTTSIAHIMYVQVHGSPAVSGSSACWSGSCGAIFHALGKNDFTVDTVGFNCNLISPNLFLCSVAAFCPEQFLQMPPICPQSSRLMG